MPVTWDQLRALKGGARWTIFSAPEYLSFQKDDPWAAYWSRGQELSEAMSVLDFEPPKSPRDLQGVSSDRTYER